MSREFAGRPEISNTAAGASRGEDVPDGGVLLTTDQEHPAIPSADAVVRAPEDVAAKDQIRVRLAGGDGGPARSRR